MNGQIQYGLFRSMTSVVTHGSANLGLPRRLAAFRHELHMAGGHPTRSTLEQLATVVRQLNLQDHDIEDELEDIRACADGLDLADEIARDNLPVVATIEPLPAGDVCHFATPVRFGRRRTDRFGHLQLTNGWLTFRAARAAVLAEHFARVARRRTIIADATCHAWV